MHSLLSKLNQHCLWAKTFQDRIYRIWIVSQSLLFWAFPMFILDQLWKSSSLFVAGARPTQSNQLCRQKYPHPPPPHLCLPSVWASWGRPWRLRNMEQTISLGTPLVPNFYLDALRAICLCALRAIWLRPLRPLEHLTLSSDICWMDSVLALGLCVSPWIVC